MSRLAHLITFLLILLILIHTEIFPQNKEKITATIDSLDKTKNMFQNGVNKIQSQIDSINTTLKDVYLKENLIDTITGEVLKNELIHQSPNLYSKNLFLAKKGEIIKILDYNEGWFLISHKMRKGYLLEQFVYHTKAVLDYKKNKLQKQILIKAEKDSLCMLEFRKKYHKLLITKIEASEPNSAGGIDVQIDLYNISKKEIKYITLYISAYNKVGDKVRCTARNRYQALLKITGPIAPASIVYEENAANESYWESIWYNHSITCIKIDKVVVEYMDKSRYSYVKELPKIISDEIENDCSYKEELN